MHCAGIILCGGKSTRLGEAKAMLPFGDETMLARVARLLGEVVHPLVVVAAQNQPLPPLAGEVVVVRDERPQRGPLEGLRAGLRVLEGRADAAYATSCDVPLLSPALVQHMIARLAANPACDIAVPCDEPLLHPLAAVYRVRVLPQIDALLAADRRRLSGLCESCRTLKVPVDELRSVDPQLATLLNCNRPDDYRHALAQAGLALDVNVARRLRLNEGT